MSSSKTIASGIVEVNNEHGYVNFGLARTPEEQAKAPKFDGFVSGELKYLNVPNGTKLKITVEVISE